LPGKAEVTEKEGEKRVKGETLSKEIRPPNSGECWRESERETKQSSSDPSDSSFGQKGRGGGTLKMG